MNNSAPRCADRGPELFQELVLDSDGCPETVKYHLLASLLLNELQRQERELERQRRELDDLAALRERVTALEGGERAGSPGVR